MVSLADFAEIALKICGISEISESIKSNIICFISFIIKPLHKKML